MKRNVYDTLYRLTFPISWVVLLLFFLFWLASCGFNPMEGDFGPVEWVPEQKECKTKVRYPDGRVNYEMRPCDGGGHDLEVFGEWRYL